MLSTLSFVDDIMFSHNGCQSVNYQAHSLAHAQSRIGSGGESCTRR